MTKRPNAADLWIGLATGPVLLALIAGRVASRLMQEVGEASEELFRGDRLPTLRMPSTQNRETGSDSSD